MATEGEHGQGDQGFEAFEAIGHAGQDADLGIGGFDEPVREPRAPTGLDGFALGADTLAEADEPGDAAPRGPCQPSAEGVDSGDPTELEDRAHAFFECPGTVEN